MRIIFVGLHNKPNMLPLDSLTKSGKLIDRIIKELPGIETIKSNLFNCNGIPHKDYHYKYRDEWYNTYSPTTDDVIVLLGAMTHKNFIHNPQVRGVIKIAHPASKRSHIEMNKYVNDTTAKIKSYFL